VNNIYFFCESCKVFVDAGYRWAYWTLEEPGIVRRDEAVDSDLVMATQEYWNPERDDRSQWLIKEVLPSVRHFFEEHRAHRIIFGEGDIVFDASPDWFLEWIQEGFLASPLPRFCYERVRCSSWTAVCEYINTLKLKPSWWKDLDERGRAERWYKARLVHGISDSEPFS
jgi:hypothetical protein